MTGNWGTPKGEPIMLPCLGSGSRGHALNDSRGNFLGVIMCAACGEKLRSGDDQFVPEHDTDDIIARIKRGDFDA